MARKKVRIADVAQAAGVSIATASNALSGRRQTNSETAQRVQEIASQMGYFSRTQGENTQRTVRFIVYRRSGLIIKDTPFFSDLFAGVESACAGHGYQLIFTSIDRSGGANCEERLRSVLEDTATPTLVVATEMLEDDVAPFRDFAAPLLMLDNILPGESFNCVSIDNFDAADKAVRMLRAQGHRRIGMLASSVEFENGRERLDGFRLALKRQGLSLDEKDVFCVEPTMDGAYRDMLALLDRRTAPMPTALFAMNDIVAVSVMRALRERGRRVPEDISIVGMDNMPFGRVSAPALSTLDVPRVTMARLAVERLVQLAEHQETGCVKTMVGTEPVLRESVSTVK